jgi:hypothetical protein
MGPAGVDAQFRLLCCFGSVGAPCFSRGSWTLVQREKRSMPEMGFSPAVRRRDLSQERLKRLRKKSALCQGTTFSRAAICGKQLRL